MPPWIIKAAIQGTLSRLPSPQRWNRLFQKYVTRSLDLGEDYFLHKWGQCRRHVANLRDAAGGNGPFRALELGTGWFPVTPIGLSLAGASEVVSLDQQDLVAHPQVVDVLRAYRQHISTGRIDAVSAAAVERLDSALGRSSTLSARELLAAMGVRTEIADARETSLETGCFDLICSNNTLEHIPRDVIVDIFREFGRLVAPSGIMSHFIDLADHYANFDASITVYNFLRYSSSRWRLFNNELQYQNRLRVRDFREILAESGWKLLSEDSDRKDPDVLRSVPLAPEFRRYSEDDLAVFATWMTARRS